MLEWLNHRFPPIVYGVLVALFVLASQSVAVAYSEQGQLTFRTGVVVYLFFLHLRILDEHKDFDRDVLTYPERALSRGAVTLAQLRGLGAAALAVELVLAASLGAPAFAAWAVATAFSLAMYAEFGVGAWLNQHIMVYALTHNPVTALVVLFCVFATGAPWHRANLWFIAFSSAIMLAFEVARKVRLPQEEHAGVPSYTTELGQGGARRTLGLLYGVSAVCLVGVGTSLGATPLAAALAAVGVVSPGFATAAGAQPAKRVEGAASLVLLASLAGVAGGARWLR